MSFPLTSDGAAIAQFFRQLDPNDMPVGGTATARALERGREVFARDPKSKDHVRVIVLVTDGEDLEGDPVSVAEHCQQEGTRIDVVQIGGRAPEVIPEVGADGKIAGMPPRRRGQAADDGALGRGREPARARRAGDGRDDRARGARGHGHRPDRAGRCRR